MQLMQLSRPKLHGAAMTSLTPGLPISFKTYLTSQPLIKAGLGQKLDKADSDKRIFLESFSGFISADKG